MAAFLPGRPGPDEYPSYAEKYIAHVPEEDILAALATSLEETVTLVLSADADRATGWRYAPGKWSLSEVMGHICDTERILAYRLLCIARGEATPLPSFDEDAYAAQAPYGNWPPQHLVAELRIVRASTLSLLAALPPEAWQRTGTASGKPVSVRGLAWFICGHERHHRAILRERYAAVFSEA